MTETSNAEYTDRHATSRIDAHLPLFIYGSLLGGDPFYEETFTISINGTGGLVLMASSVQPGQRIMVTNQGNDQTQECAVVSVAPQPAGSYVAFEFPTPMPQFWHGLEIGKGTVRSWIEYFIEALILQIRGDRTPERPVPDKFYKSGSQEKTQLHRPELSCFPAHVNEPDRFEPSAPKTRVAQALRLNFGCPQLLEGNSPTIGPDVPPLQSGTVSVVPLKPNPKPQAEAWRLVPDEGIGTVIPAVEAEPVSGAALDRKTISTKIAGWLGTTVASRIRLWLLSGWRCPDRRLSRG